MSVRTEYPSNWALAELPYFDVVDGLLTCDPAIGPVVDVHTHLALGFVRKLAVDLQARHHRVEHYLPVERALDLEVYANCNFSPADLRRLKRDLSLGSLTAGGMRATHTAPNLAREMAALGVVSSVLLPIDFPILSRNAENYLEAAARHDVLISLGSIHPLARGIEARLDRQVAAGARGVKIHPAVQLVPPDHPRALRIYRACAARGLPILWHCGPVGIEGALSRKMCQLYHYERAVDLCPEATFVLGHSGALQFERGLALAQRHENVYLESSSQGLTNVRRIAEEGPPDRIMFGSDWPFYHQALPLAKALLATEGEPARREAFLWRNAARLFGLTIAEPAGRAPPSK